MQKLMLMLGLTGVPLLGQAQDVPQTEVPSVVVNALQLKFPDAKDVDWELKGEQYKADFEVNKRDHDVWIDKSGKITKHKEDIEKSSIPSPIMDQIKKDFSAYKIDDADKIDEQGNVTYLVELDGTDERHVTFNAAGKILENKLDD